jgi:hypothetical protein
VGIVTDGEIMGTDSSNSPGGQKGLTWVGAGGPMPCVDAGSRLVNRLDMCGSTGIANAGDDGL